MRQTERLPVQGIVRNDLKCVFKNVIWKKLMKSAISFICQRAMLNRMVFFMRRPACGSICCRSMQAVRQISGERHSLLDCTDARRKPSASGKGTGGRRGAG